MNEKVDVCCNPKLGYLQQDPKQVNSVVSAIEFSATYLLVFHNWP